MGSSSFFTSAGATVKTLTVAVGSTVTWTNDSGVAHNVLWNDAAGRNAAAAGDGTGDMPDFASGSHTRVFTVAGTYKFYCSIHGTPTSGMTGTLIVQ
jgi:plastocyanin